MSLFEELKRRNVFRVSIGYIVSSWLLVQVADLVLENIGSPARVIQTIMLVLALGFPVVAFFSWAYEVTPDGIKRESEVDRTQSITHLTAFKLDRAIIAVLLLALGYFIWESRFSADSRARAEKGSETLSNAATIATVGAEKGSDPFSSFSEKSIAVLPFSTRSEVENDRFFSDGMHDDLLTQLAKIGDLKVISRTSVTEYRDTAKNLRQIGAELGVASIMEGAIQRSGS